MLDVPGGCSRELDPLGHLSGKIVEKSSKIVEKTSKSHGRIIENHYRFLKLNLVIWEPHWVQKIKWAKKRIGSNSLISNCK